jgi:NADH-quinone oxidoreductase subunit D
MALMDSSRRRTLRVGAMAPEDHAILGLGPHHPSMHGLMRLHLQVDDGVVVAADPEIGFVHRGAEKLFEVRDYRQLLSLANRHDWLSAFAGELGVALAVEELLGLTVPTRAVWARTLLAELTRIFSHLSFLQAFPTSDPGQRPSARGEETTAQIQHALERYSGARLHVAATRIGGLHADLDSDWLDDLVPLLDRARRHTAGLREQLLCRPQHVGVVTAELARTHGASGPVARASGLDLDLRRDDPYLAYDELFGAGGPGRVVTAQAGDVAARLQCLLDQVEVAADLVAECRERILLLPPGPVGTRLPKTLRVPQGESYVWTETPLGIAGFLLVSDGSRTPWRLKLRSPSFAHLSLLPAMLPGVRLDEVGSVLASLCYVLGDADR